MRKIIEFLSRCFSERNVQTALDYSLGRKKPSLCERIKYDVNKDGKINVQDVKLTMNEGDSE